MTKAHVVLNMIVKDESEVIRECLESVSPFIDAYCIVDTGSSDNTIDLIKSFFAEKGIPGEVHERPWVNFGHNRSEALKLARKVGEYAFVIDADDVLHGTPDFSNLKADCYYVQIMTNNIIYWREQLLASRRKWRYEGVVHEYLRCETTEYTSARQDTSWYIESRRIGARNKDGSKYLRDIELLKADLENDPSNTRSMFYLAQSYYDMGDFANSLDHYAKRAVMGGWDEEVFYSKYRIGLCLMSLGRHRGEIVDAMLDAWEYRPSRAEPLYHLTAWHRLRGLHGTAVIFGRQAVAIPMPSDRLFVAEEMYAWRIKDELAVASSFTGDIQTTYNLCTEIVEMDLCHYFTEEDRARVQANLEFAKKTLGIP